MRMRKAPLLALAAVVAILIASVGWYFVSPAYTLRQMKAAAERNDPDGMSAYIDYPALREDLKAELMARLMAESKKDKTGFGGLGLAFGSAMMGPMIDGMVSPAGVRAAMIANRNNPNVKAPSVAADLQVPEQPVILRRGLSEFLVTTKAQPNSGMVFKRHGLSWKLSGIDLPPE